MKEHMADWRIHALAFVLTVIAEFIGTKKFSFGPLSFSLFPMLYVLILGAILGIVKLIPQKMMTEASPYIGISVMMLTAKIASTIGPNLGAVVKAGPALILQEFGNLGTAVLALPPYLCSIWDARQSEPPSLFQERAPLRSLLINMVLIRMKESVLWVDISQVLYSEPCSMVSSSPCSAP